jgi:hypothetical protein
MCKDLKPTQSKHVEEPFEVVKDFRSVMQKKRRKLLRSLHKESQLRERTRFLHNSKSLLTVQEKTQSVKRYYSQEEEFNMFFEDSANLRQDTDEFGNAYFVNDIDFKEDS